jgi:membrane protein implicated in regulation of membrane protease activity
MPWGDWINDLPTGFFLAVHIAAFAIGAVFAWTAFKRELPLLGYAFSLFAAAELTYMTYHLDWTVFLFAHTIAEVLDLAAFVLVFAGAVTSVVRRPALGVTSS